MCGNVADERAHAALDGYFDAVGAAGCAAIQMVAMAIAIGTSGARRRVWRLGHGGIDQTVSGLAPAAGAWLGRGGD